MAHWRKMMDPKNTLSALDLDGRDVVLEIESVTAGEVTGDGGRKSKKPIISFKGTTKKLAANATNCKAIATLFGSHETNDWVGRKVTLFPTTCELAGQIVDCIRIRPTIPKATGKDGAGDLKAAS